MSELQNKGRDQYFQGRGLHIQRKPDQGMRNLRTCLENHSRRQYLQDRHYPPGQNQSEKIEISLHKPHKPRKINFPGFYNRLDIALHAS